MNDTSTIMTLAAPPDVEEFAADKGIRHYLDAVINLARQAFPGAALLLSVGHDVEDETHRYIAIDLDTTGLTTAELVGGQRSWSAGLTTLCPARYAVYFVLGWR